MVVVSSLLQYRGGPSILSSWYFRFAVEVDVIFMSVWFVCNLERRRDVLVSRGTEVGRRER